MFAFSKSTALLVFGKLPGLGQVKTRLVVPGSGLNPAATSELYQAMLLDTLENASRTRRKVFFAYLPSDSWGTPHGLLAGLSSAHRSRIVPFPQRGRDFASRLNFAIHEVRRRGARAVVVTGTDCPELSSNILGGALLELERTHTMLLGPAPRGGVYLIGLPPGVRLPRTGVFGEGRELELLSALATLHRRPIRLLPVTSDIDLPEDLASLRKRLRRLPPDRVTCPRTLQFLNAHLDLQMATLRPSKLGPAPPPPNSGSYVQRTAG